ncbi:MAG: hypothetical protein Q9227_007143 [Pyrenula ochraceoflavens]
MASSDSADGQTHHSSILILGAGIFGTSTAYHLAQTHPDPSSITVLDRAPCPSPRAASSDINKIVRADYSSPFYMALAYEAMAAWSTWPILKDFYHRTGWVMLDEKGSDLAERIRKNFRESGHKDESEDISFDEMKTRWGGVFSGIDTEDYDKAYVNPSAGWCDASQAVEAMMKDAISKGIRYEVGEVTELVLSSSTSASTADTTTTDKPSSPPLIQSLKTTTNKTHTFDKLLLCTGSWTPWLLTPLEHSLSITPTSPLSINTQLTTAGVCTTAFRLPASPSPLLSHYTQMPILIYGAKGEAMPPSESNRLLKFTNAHTFTNPVPHPNAGSQLISVPSPDQHAVPPNLKAQSLQLIRQRAPDLLSSSSSSSSASPEEEEEPSDDEKEKEKAEIVEWRLCWDAITPHQHQLITQHPHPSLSNLYLATGGSFHSWKFLPVIGKYVVNVLGGKGNGGEKDEAWGWKGVDGKGGKGEGEGERGAHEKVLPKTKLEDWVEGEGTGDVYLPY